MIEDGALEQAKNLANLPFAFSHIAIMADSHRGYGMPIGGVMATHDVVVPNAAGVDLGCGVCAVKTPWEQVTKDQLLKIKHCIQNEIPVGFSHRKDTKFFDRMPGYVPENGIVAREYDKARYQLGSLGGGNHFIELQMGSDGFVWIMIHSGSRNLGKQVADHYNKRAVVWNKIIGSGVPSNFELPYFTKETIDYHNYILEMQYCVNFALTNRMIMMEQVVDICHNVFKHKKVDMGELINIAHNYVTLEHHFGKSVMVHRKGATRAGKDQLGIIPGSQGTYSYIVKGKGNLDSFVSCSHGAGRKMGRKQAQRELDLSAEINKLNSLGVIHDIRTVNDLDEASGAYKDIEDVMNNQADLVSIEVKLKPLMVVKG